MSGTTMHGSQELNCIVGGNPEVCDRPTSYYEFAGPLGSVASLVRENSAAIDIGVVGLGVGTVSSYCRSGDTITFFEIDPSVIRIAESEFRFLGRARSRCRDVRIVTGDARLSLRTSPRRQYDLLVADAFNSDAVPVHLVTAEALSEFAATLRPRGVIAYHVSSRYFDLAAVIRAAGVAAGLNVVAVKDQGGRARVTAQWVFLTADPQRHRSMEDSLLQIFEGPKNQNRLLLTDERQSLLKALRSGQPE